MAHFAKIENDGTISNVIVIADEDCAGGQFPESETAGQDFIASLGIEGRWLQTSYNTSHGEHLNGGTPLRWNYAFVDGHYDDEKDAFIPPKMSDEQILDETIMDWVWPEVI